jgi:hypothetical protein
MPIRVLLGGDGSVKLRPTEQWQTTALALEQPDAFRVDENYYVKTRWVDAPGGPSRATGAR